MGNEVLFSETQKFRQWWLWALLIGINGLFFFGIYTQLIRGIPFGDKPASDHVLIIVSAGLLLITLMFLIYRLETQITKDGISIRFLPYRMKSQFYPFDTLHKAYVRQYSAITEYGGWGIRLGLGGNGRAYNVSGNQGLQLEFTDHKKLLIGTQKPEEIAGVLRKIGQYKEF